MVSSPKPPLTCGPIPTQMRAQTRGCITWVEMESRTFIFGCVLNEPDAFSDAFIRELRARPDLSQVVIRSETSPGREVEVFGDGPGAALPVLRYRQFDAPPASPLARPAGSGQWNVGRSAVDVLYDTHIKGPGRLKMPLEGYLQMLSSRNASGWFFWFKKFPVKYLAIADPVANRHHSVLARNLAWAALRARGDAQGEYEWGMYARASDVMFQKRAEELCAWGPTEWALIRSSARLRICTMQ